MTIIHQDDHIVVVDKPSGLLSVPGRGPEKIDSVAHRIRSSIPECIDQPAVHRLDMDTSGLLVLALNKEAHRNLSKQFQDRLTGKEYFALLDGNLAEDLGKSGTITLPFRLDIDNRPYQIYDEIHGKMGTTHWRRISVENGITRMHFQPVTGRTHQLRVHSAHPKGLGLPILDDPLYGNGADPGKMKLHAAKLSFDHPFTGERLTFTSPAPF
ncbi:RluA family pseudouridine synthase [Akkermansiaceae bacterium]|nr:RluA family pseudouridine synthase [Akkermansiaceae bacterium]